MTPAEIRQVYDQGPDAVIALVTSLFDVIAAQSRQIEQLRQHNEQLSVRVAALEAQLAKNSRNSSKPPASDALKKAAPKSLRDKTGRKPGGQVGHAGTTLPWSAQPDHILTHCPEQCTHCGAALNAALGRCVERRQVQDLPPMQVLVTEHQVHHVVCPCCHQQNQGTFPEGVVAKVQYGPRIKGLGVYLTHFQLLPLARAAALLQDLLGVRLNPSTLCHTQNQCAAQLAPLLQRIKGALQQVPLAHFDETGVRIDTKLHWLHVCSTERLTFYATHKKRGHEAMTQIGILPTLSGRAIHDGWASYFSYPCPHGLCNAHHLRELSFLAEDCGYLWAHAFARLLRDMKAAVDQAKAQGQCALEGSVRLSFEARYQALLAEGYAAHPARGPSGKRGRPAQSAGRNLVRRLEEHREATLAFLYDFRVPFDNNQAERDVRMMKLRLKISGCFRTPEGADTFCAIRSYLSTMLKQGHNPLQILTQLVRNHIVEPALQT